MQSSCLVPPVEVGRQPPSRKGDRCSHPHSRPHSFYYSSVLFRGVSNSTLWPTVFSRKFPNSHLTFLSHISVCLLPIILQSIIRRLPFPTSLRCIFSIHDVGPQMHSSSNLLHHIEYSLRDPWCSPNEATKFSISNYFK